MAAVKSFVFRFGDVEVREREFTLIRAGEVLPVQPKIFNVLIFLLHNPRRLITKEELLSAVWGDTVVTESSLTRIIALLRRTLGDDIAEPRYIATVAKVGYRFVCPVEVAEDAPAAPAPTVLTSGVNGYVHETPPANPPSEGKKKARHRWLALAAIPALVLMALGWYMLRPLPPPRITSYTKITHDGQGKRLVATDGNRLYLDRDAPTGIGQVAVSGGEIAPVPVAEHDAELQDVSQDGSALAVTSDAERSVAGNSIWTVRTLSGSVRRLAHGRNPAFSPDGNSVAYSTLQGEIRLARSDGTGDQRLASVGGVADGIAWSPDGSVLRFSMNNRLWEIKAGGSNLHELLPGWHSSSIQCCGHWTPDGKFFIFRSQSAVWFPQGADLWVIDERRGLFRQSRSEPAQLTTGPVRWDWPVTGRDGRNIFAVGTIPRGELSRFDAQTKQFQPFLGGISAQGISFSKDGKSVAYVLYPEGTLWKANRDGSNPVQLTDPPFEAFLPRWSPDGTQILFTRVANFGSTTTHNEIYLVSAEGGSPQNLLPEDKGLPSEACWSPDGRKIVFASRASMARGAHADIRVLDLASRRVTTLPESVGIYSPRCSPDGRLVAALKGSNRSLGVFDFETQRWSELPLKGSAAFNNWSGDSKRIYFVFSPDHGDRGIYRIRVTGGDPELVVDLKDWHWAGWWGSWIGLDPTDAPLLLRNIASSDIYALNLDER
jgi:DNA-binding winged helix-turn-helix (wHTH) protein/Tol biopolymer transport system component